MVLRFFLVFFQITLLHNSNVDKDKYVGYYLNNKFDGIGKLEFSNKNALYKGTFKNGMRNGKGE